MEGGSEEMKERRNMRKVCDLIYLNNFGIN